jgi:GNAT superfamily N-acetyltransferase
MEHLMHNTVDLVTYEPSFIYDTAQAYLDIFSAAPWNETFSYNDVLFQLQTDQERPGFGGLLFKSPSEVSGFAWWYDVTGTELYDLWRPRFSPRESIPMIEGRISLLMDFGVRRSLRNKGLGQRLLKAALGQIEPTHDWVVLTTHDFAHAALALLRSNGFETLPLKGVQKPSQIALYKELQH